MPEGLTAGDSLWKTQRNPPQLRPKTLGIEVKHKMTKCNDIDCSASVFTRLNPIVRVSIFIYWVVIQPLRCCGVKVNTHFHLYFSPLLHYSVTSHLMSRIQSSTPSWALTNNMAAMVNWQVEFRAIDSEYCLNSSVKPIASWSFGICLSFIWSCYSTREEKISNVSARPLAWLQLTTYERGKWQTHCTPHSLSLRSGCLLDTSACMAK